MEKESSGLFQIVGGLGIIVGLGTIGYLLSTQSNQKKWSFEDWVQKSDVSLTYFENNDKSNGIIMNGGNWWEFKNYVIDSKESNCMEEIKQLGVLSRNESIRRFPNCRIGTLDYLISEYKKYNPGGSIPYGITGELTISEGGKETKGTNPINTSSTYTNTQKTFTDKTPSNQQTNTPIPSDQTQETPVETQKSSISIRTTTGHVYTVQKEHLNCYIKFIESKRDNISNSGVSGPEFEIFCESYGTLEDLTGKKVHHYDEDKGPYVKNWCFSSGYGYLSDSGRYSLSEESTRPDKWMTLSCLVGEKFGVIQSLKNQGYKWKSNQPDPTRVGM